VLVVDDQVEEINWLLDILIARGYEIVLVSDEDSAIFELGEVRAGRAQYDLAIVDVMVAAKSIEAIVDELAAAERGASEANRRGSSSDAGIRICQYARTVLGLGEAELPIQVLTVRQDKAVMNAMKRLGIPISERLPKGTTRPVVESVFRLLGLKQPPAGE